MKVHGVKQFSSLDPPDIRELSKSDRDRETRRLHLIKKFMSWAYWKESDRWTQANNDERIIVKRQVSYAKILVGFGLFSNFAIYFAFMTGIYNFRTNELVNMKSVPFPIKFTITSLVAYTMCVKLYEKQVYEPELYRIALKYRP